MFDLKSLPKSSVPIQAHHICVKKTSAYIQWRVSLHKSPKLMIWWIWIHPLLYFDNLWAENKHGLERSSYTLLPVNVHPLMFAVVQNKPSIRGNLMPHAIFNKLPRWKFSNLELYPILDLGISYHNLRSRPVVTLQKCTAFSIKLIKAFFFFLRN